jgi:hypothetical protein
MLPWGGNPGHAGDRCHNLTAMTETTGAADVAEASPCQCPSCVSRAQRPRVRASRWITAHSDLTKPPAPLIRWALLLILGLCCWAAGIPLDIKDWLGPIIVAGALILPDVSGFGVAGVRLDLREAKDEIAALRLRVDVTQAQTQTIHIHPGAPARVLGRSIAAEIGERAADANEVGYADDLFAEDVPS